jgi:hypothetical protein
MDGGGICCWSGSNPTITGNTIKGNWAISFPGVGGGICCSNSHPRITNNVIRGNAAQYGGAVSCSWDSDPEIINNSISENVACGEGPYGGYGGGVYSARGSNPVIINTILWADTAEWEGNEIYVDSQSSVAITYCDIQDTLWPGVGNVSVDPLFRDPQNADFHLQSITNPDCGGPGDSPCIDAGDSSIVDTLISCDWGLGTLRSDMGAYGGGDSLQVGIPEQQENIPTCFYLSQNYPNPFNTATAISYQLPTNNRVRLEIYNLLGQKVATVVDSKQQTGYRSVVWDASEVSSGPYFYKLTAGDFTGTRRMILLR